MTSKLPVGFPMPLQLKKTSTAKHLIIAAGILLAGCVVFGACGNLLRAISPSTETPLLAPSTQTPKPATDTAAASSATLSPTITRLPTLQTVAITAAATRTLIAAPSRTMAPAFTATEPAVVVPSETAPAVSDTATEPPPVENTATAPAPAGIKLVSLTSPISPGQNATLVVQVSAGAACFLMYITPAGTDSTAKGLGNTAADGNGHCTWTWKIGSSTRSGTGQLSVSSDGQSARYDIVIQ
jgi:hypothetical protein